MPNQKWMEKGFHSEETTKIPLAASSYARCARQGASGNFAFLGRIRVTDEIWNKANKKLLLLQQILGCVIHHQIPVSVSSITPVTLELISLLYLIFYHTISTICTIFTRRSHNIISTHFSNRKLQKSVQVFQESSTLTQLKKIHTKFNANQSQPISKNIILHLPQIINIYPLLSFNNTCFCQIYLPTVMNGLHEVPKRISHNRHYSLSIFFQYVALKNFQFKRILQIVV